MQHRSLASLFALSLAATVVATGCSPAEEQQQQQQQAPEVGVVTLTTQAVPLTTELPGRTRAYQIAEVRPQVGGILLERQFEEGAEVEAGEQLYQIDPNLYDAQFNSAEASVERAKAAQRSAKAQFDRFENLLDDRAISQQDFDDAEASYLQAEAELRVAEAEYERARLDREYTKVLAPISGRIGRSNYTAGALLTASQSEPLAVIQQLDPIYIDITQSSRDYFKLKNDIESGRIEASEEGNPPVVVTFENGIDYDVKGELLFSDVSVDEGTGAIALRAIVENPNGDLLPGMFVRARVTEGVLRDALLVPQQGVTRDARGRAVAMVVNSDGEVEARSVTTDRTIGNQWLVTEGLEEGDKVIVEGLQMIQPGAQVRPVEADIPLTVEKGKAQ